MDIDALPKAHKSITIKPLNINKLNEVVSVK